VTDAISLRDIRLCLEGVIPAVIATASADGTPNVTYLSKVLMVDDERVALSNQFFSKTSRNLAENPRASILLIHPLTYDQYRLTLVYERTERRGAVFEHLRDDVDAIAALQGMQDVFKLRAADIYRVLDIEQVLAAVHLAPQLEPPSDAVRDEAGSAAQLGELTARLSRCPDLDTLVTATVAGLDELFGYEHSLLLLVDEEGKQLYTIASKGYDVQGVGSEVTVGEGIIGMAAARCTPIRLGNLRQMAKYSRTVRRSYEDEGHIGPGCEIPVPGLEDPQSRVAVPAMAFGQLVGVLVVESDEPVAFTSTDEAMLTVVASLVANAIEVDRTHERSDEKGAGSDRPVATVPEPSKPSTHVRFFAVDGSTFLDGDYLIKGVSGRILWSLLGQFDREGRVEFTNREVRLDPSLELPEFRDNFESRLILLKRRLDERRAPIRIEKTGRGRFRLVVDRPLRLEAA
jgi:predicted pyridoxine 5'-phosphate oxidase superfamily flavin-nucleotide-binding protein